MLRPLLCCTLLLWLAGCKPEPPEKERPPEPQAASGLSTAIQAPLEKARAVEDQVQESAEAQRASIDEAVGG